MTNGHDSLLSLFPKCFQVSEGYLICSPFVDGMMLLGGSLRGDAEKTSSSSFYNFLLEKLEHQRVLLSFVVVVYAALQGKFPAHPGGEGIMTGLLSGEEEVRAESQQSLFDGFSYTVSISSQFISE